MRTVNGHSVYIPPFFFILLAFFILSFPHALYAEDSEGHINTDIEMIEGNDRLTLSIHDADIRSVLKALSVKKKLNIVTGQDVAGKISINIYDLPLKEVLDAVITLNGFNYVRKGDIIFVSRAGVNPEGDLPGAEVMTFKLNYVNLDEVEKVVGKLVSQSAKITLYRPEKTLIVEDAPQNLDRVRKILQTLDVPPKQVLIETSIMEIRLNDDTSLGINWRDAFKGFIGSSGNIITDGFTGATQGLFFDVVNDDFNLFLEALQNRTEVNTLATPRLLALDNKQAKIIIGGKLGYFVTTVSDGAVLQSVQFLETGTQLVLTPHINDDGRVIMDIHPEVSDATIINGLPTETTTEVTTSLIAPDGGTIFIGGLIRDRKEDIRERVPGLGSIPVIGALFGRTSNITVRTEIIVLITPHIISAANKDILEKDAQKVDDVENTLQKERSLRELVPGI
ncbi:MAG: secretin and TonB N-terminal domain-containing protein [Nitrospirae bacterium]|nr:secretin and TonB N-terminal domain-containing protein [Nitrospirota bacterium]